ncbi:hypothetical protein BB559_001444 [Furculomyces boomerangus]|uniref:Swiss Army Knife 2H phosphoesterase domain-containing protein n=2 Tax=Harpellales TaxID=61421 RepID=A0A2T9Z1X1_9FUNG|nr:hypothetical protein BB559_001444 [Furculomyces boomerangus]PWA03561.1 hypothetical protein BB558_000249 [Smittium angustum]
MFKLFLVATTLVHTALSSLYSPSYQHLGRFGSSCPNDLNLTISSEIYNGNKMPFLKFEGDKPFMSYLQMTLPYEPASQVFKAINSTVGKGLLLNRGEAHITIITPPEFDNILKPAGVTMKEINQIAIDKDIQNSRFQVVCMGRARINQSAVSSTGASQPTVLDSYMIIVWDSHNDLRRIREKIFSLYVSKGGERSLFDPDNFSPHITLGFNVRDLFVEDGVYKGANACIETLTVV